MSDKKKIDEDYELSRDTYMELIENGKRSLDLMMEVARESEHPRAFEVLSGMIKNVADVTDKLMELNKRVKDVNEEKGGNSPKSITQNNVFLGSTTELQKFLKNEKLVQDENVIDVSVPKDD